MREKDKLHFSPSFIFSELDFEDQENLIVAFKDRVYGFYLKPADLLCENGMGFACGLLCIATIDSLARLSYPKSNARIEDWLKNYIPEFQEADFAHRFYEDFRCGLVHEGRIKPFGEFSYESKQLVLSVQGIIRINPHLLLKRVIQAFEQYLTELKRDPNELQIFKTILKKDYETEVAHEMSA